MFKLLKEDSWVLIIGLAFSIVALGASLGGGVTIGPSFYTTVLFPVGAALAFVLLRNLRQYFLWGVALLALSGLIVSFTVAGSSTGSNYDVVYTSAVLAALFIAISVTLFIPRTTSLPLCILIGSLATLLLAAVLGARAFYSTTTALLIISSFIPFTLFPYYLFAALQYRKISIQPFNAKGSVEAKGKFYAVGESVAAELVTVAFTKDVGVEGDRLVWSRRSRSLDATLATALYKTKTAPFSYYRLAIVVYGTTSKFSPYLHKLRLPASSRTIPVVVIHESDKKKAVSIAVKAFEDAKISTADKALEALRAD